MQTRLTKIPKNNLFIQVTYKDLLNKLWLISLLKVNCEIYIPPEIADSIGSIELDRIKAVLDKSGILRLMHAPVCDPYKDGPVIFKESYLRTSKLCKALASPSMIMHVEYEYGKSPSLEKWLRDTGDIWNWISNSAKRDNLHVFLENHAEASAEPITKILDYTRSENLKACFDIGHFNVFGRKELSSFLDDYPMDSIREIHLSDNFGDRDAHLGLGRGGIDFLNFFNIIDTKGIKPIYTIEAKNIWGVMIGIWCLKKIGKL